MRFEIREIAIPGLTPVWNSEVNVALGLVPEPQRVPTDG